MHLEIANIHIRAQLRLQNDIAARVIVNLTQGFVDPANPLLDGFSLSGQLPVEVGDFIDRIDVEQLLETLLKPREVVTIKLLQQVAILIASIEIGIELAGLQFVGLLECDHGPYDPVPQPLEHFGLSIHFPLQRFTHFTLGIVARLNGKQTVHQDLAAQGLQLNPGGFIDWHQ